MFWSERSGRCLARVGPEDVASPSNLLPTLKCQPRLLPFFTPSREQLKEALFELDLKINSLPGLAR